MLANRLSELESQFAAFSSDFLSGEEAGDDAEYRKTFMTILQDSCALIREAETQGSVELDNLVVRVDTLINEAIAVSYGDPGLYDFIPSFAHKEGTFLKGKHAEGNFSRGMLDQLQPFLRMLMEISGGTTIPMGEHMPKPPPPWNTTMKPHPNTTPLARFHEDIPAWSATTSTPTATAVYEARCEVSSDSISGPIQLTMSSGGACLAIPSMGGYKNRTPMLHYYLLDEESDGDFLAEHFVTVGLSEIAYHSATDEARKLIFVGDGYRIKSYAWASSSGTSFYKRPLPTHTLDSGACAGPMAILPNGRFIRAGKGLVEVWNIDALPTHGPKGKTRIGGRFNIEDSWRDDPEDIECSQGSTSDSTIKFEDRNFIPAKWHTHPSAPGVMLCASGDRTSKKYFCATLDLEHGGKTVARYLGHGGIVEDFSTCTSDPNVFVTACSDGLARLYDVRHPLPTLTFDAGERSQVCPAALIADPDGILTVFTGTDSSEKIEMWDVRAHTPVYELATGNNSVNAMAWDPSRNSLYAATECNYVDRLGYHHDYRKAKMPKSTRAVNGDDEEMEDENDENDEDDEDYEDEDEDDEDDDEYRCWPQRAHHGEDYFGYAFDAGEHRIYRYAFKEDADNQVLPPYGDATLEGGDYF